MKKILFTLLTCFAVSAHGQVYTDATAASGSASQSASGSIATGGSSTGGTAIGATDFTVSPQVSITS